MRNLRSTIERHGYAFSVISVVLATALFFLGRDYFAKGQWAMLYLLITGLIAGLCGVRPAILAALLSFLAWNFFFLPPYHTLEVHDPKDWLSLFVFLIVGVAAGALTGRIREREAQAIAREREMALLNEFSAHLVSDAEVADTAETLLREVCRTTRAKCAAMFVAKDGGEFRESYGFPNSSCATDHEIQRIAAWAHEQAKAVGLPNVPKRPRLSPGGWPISVDHAQAGAESERRDMFIPMQTAAYQAGVLYIGEREKSARYTTHDAQLLVAIANQTAAFLERKRLQAIAIQADVLREADKLKSVFVSSISHELKTPLASLTATVTNILEGDVEWDEEGIRQELQAIGQDLDRLNGSISSLVDLSRLEAAAWEPNMDWHEFGDILGTTISRIPEKDRARISFTLPDDLPPFRVDFLQLVRVLQNLLENALLYSGKDSQVRVGASASAREIVFWVEDEGPGIPPEERAQVFNKFFRGKSAALSPTGTGLGLAITREIVRFHGGSIRIEDVTPHGSRFVVSLPIIEPPTATAGP